MAFLLSALEQQWVTLQILSHERAVSLNHLCLVRLSMPKDTGDPCAWPTCLDPVIGTPLNSQTYQRMVLGCALTAYPSQIPYISLETEAPFWISPLLVGILSVLSSYWLSVAARALNEGLALNSLQNNTFFFFLTNAVIIVNCNRLSWEIDVDSILTGKTEFEATCRRVLMPNESQLMLIILHAYFKVLAL